MPRLCLDTNLPVSKINQDFLSGSLTLLSNILDKDCQFCLTTVNADLKMTLCKSNEPCGIVEIMCIGNLGPKENKTHISIITNYMYQKLGIPKDRNTDFITFGALRASLIVNSHSSTSFSGILVQLGVIDWKYLLYRGYMLSKFVILRLLVFFHSNTYEGAGYLGTTLHHLYCQK
ncbi:macrophage migration inhibitory factor homolog [Daktulosphaira vitifoliae]|uniref:macrophage migration inhibitory factor homolog n=1 Tax=Daktulosphaira vitifoliae TaxID=58002 RepID=UPI0021AA7990|nr:macrophage migration inhibitory factor homolog [Daktulosphaira vitifoliae]